MKKIALLLITLVLVTAACKKKNADPADEPVDSSQLFKADFEWSGKQYVYAPILFTSNHETNDLTLIWYINNIEKTSEGKTLQHTFEQPGRYTVTMSRANGGDNPVTKEITITNGLERVSGNQKWNCLLHKHKHGQSGQIQPESFQTQFELKIVDNYTLEIPDIPQMPLRGPYTLKLKEVTSEKLLLESEDKLKNMSYTYNDYTAGFEITQVRNDTTWRVTGLASIFN